MFDVFEQAVVVVLFLQLLIEAGCVVSAEINGNGNGIGVARLFGQNVFECLSESIRVIGFEIFVERSNAVIKTVVKHADVAALQGEAETVATQLRNTAGTLQYRPLRHADRSALRGLGLRDAAVVVIGAYGS